MRRFEGRCYWCACPVQLYPHVQRRGAIRHADEATADHLVSRLHPQRGQVHGTLVLACNACNNRRATEEASALPIEALWMRSRSAPRAIKPLISLFRRRLGMALDAL